MIRRFIQVNGELIEVGPGYRAPVRRHDEVLWNDRAYQDMNDPRFNSRKSHREYMKRNNLSTVDDYKQQWAKAEQERGKFYRGEDPSRRAEIARAFEKPRRRG